MAACFNEWMSHCLMFLGVTSPPPDHVTLDTRPVSHGLHLHTVRSLSYLIVVCVSDWSSCFSIPPSAVIAPLNVPTLTFASKSALIFNNLVVSDTLMDMIALNSPPSTKPEMKVSPYSLLKSPWSATSIGLNFVTLSALSFWLMTLTWMK